MSFRDIKENIKRNNKLSNSYKKAMRTIDTSKDEIEDCKKYGETLWFDSTNGTLYSSYDSDKGTSWYLISEGKKELINYSNLHNISSFREIAI